jgi:hypothetical protein
MTWEFREGDTFDFEHGGKREVKYHQGRLGTFNPESGVFYFFLENSNDGKTWADWYRSHGHNFKHAEDQTITKTITIDKRVLAVVLRAETMIAEEYAAFTKAYNDRQDTLEKDIKQAKRKLTKKAEIDTAQLTLQWNQKQRAIQARVYDTVLDAAQGREFRHVLLNDGEGFLTDDVLAPFMDKIEQ